MRTVWKKILRDEETQQLAWPRGSTIVSAGVQDQDICIWFNVPDVDAERETVTVYVRGMGTRVPPEADYVATVFLGTFVFHIFQRVSA